MEKTKEEILDHWYEIGKHWQSSNRYNILKAMQEYHDQFKDKSCDAMGHYGGEKPEGICPKCGKPWKSSESGEQDELWNEVGAILYEAQSFKIYKHILAELKSKFHIVKK